MTPTSLPPDHAARMERARLSLEGLSVGDAFGSQFFLPGVGPACLPSRRTPPVRNPWTYTDDTEMALGIVEVLARRGDIDQYELATVFARRYRRDVFRGYGGMAHVILAEIGRGTPWRNASHAAFDGRGSLGNGASMRVAPLGAYFAEDPEAVVSQADRSAEVTHAHPEGRAGAVAVATAAAWAWVNRAEFIGGRVGAGGRLLNAALERTPDGETRERLVLALALPAGAGVERAVNLLGNGSRVTAPDTVPFCLWAADHCLGDFPEALWTTVGAGGDIDTTCAIVGGVVALACRGIPPGWVAAREELDAEERRVR
jgi:ADP-ribosylglycohydrolase